MKINIFTAFFLLIINSLNAQSLLLKSELFQEKEYISLADAIQNQEKVHRLNLSSMRNIHDRIAEGKTNAGVHIESIPYQLFPMKILELYNLQILQINYHELSELPFEIEELTHLQVLDLSQNKLSNLPISLKNLHHLEALDLRNNAFSEIPDVIYELKKLKIINLSGNRISKEGQIKIQQKLDKIRVIF